MGWHWDTTSRPFPVFSRFGERRILGPALIILGILRKDYREVQDKRLATVVDLHSFPCQSQDQALGYWTYRLTHYRVYGAVSSWNAEFPGFRVSVVPWWWAWELFWAPARLLRDSHNPHCTFRSPHQAAAPRPACLAGSKTGLS